MLSYIPTQILGPTGAHQTLRRDGRKKLRFPQLRKCIKWQGPGSINQMKVTNTHPPAPKMLSQLWTRNYCFNHITFEKMKISHLNEMKIFYL